MDNKYNGVSQLAPADLRFLMCCSIASGLTKRGCVKYDNHLSARTRRIELSDDFVYKLGVAEKEGEGGGAGKVARARQSSKLEARTRVSCCRAGI